MTMSSLYHQARCAALALYESEYDTRAMSADHLAHTEARLLEDDVASDLAAAAMVVMGLAAVGVDPEQLLKDILLSAEFNPDGEPEEAILRLVEQHLVDARSSSSLTDACASA